MRMVGRTGGRFFFALGFAGALVQACGGESSGPPGGTGGSTGSGGSNSGGAVSGTGGASPSTGGSKAGSGGISSGGSLGAGGKATGGVIGAGGKATGGAGGAGGKGTGGTKATGGTTGTGGKATGGTGPVDHCAPADASNDCTKCILTACCDEWLACNADESCSTSPSSEGEFFCIQKCVIDSAGETSIAACAEECQVDNSGVSAATSELIGCMRMTDENGLQACSTACFGTEL